MSFFRNTQSKKPHISAAIDDDDDWQTMPVVKSSVESAPLDDEDRQRYRWRAPSPTLHSDTANPAGGSSSKASSSRVGNATGGKLNVKDARGYDWRAAPASLGFGVAGGQDDAEDDDMGDEDESGKGYTQLRLDEDEESEAIHAATSYLFGDGAAGAGVEEGATPLSQMATTKQLLSEGQKIAYVGLCSLIAKDLVSRVKKGSGKHTDAAARSADEWITRVMARLYQHMDIEVSEQKMIDSLAEHGVLSMDLAPSLITTQSVENPDFDPEVKRDREAAATRKKELEAASEAPPQGGLPSKNHDERPPTTSPSPEEAPPPAYSARVPNEQAESTEAIDTLRRPPDEDTSDVALAGDDGASDEDDSDDGDIGASRTKASPRSKVAPLSAAVGLGGNLDEEGDIGDVGGDGDVSRSRAEDVEEEDGDISAAIDGGRTTPTASRTPRLTASASLDVPDPSPTMALADPNTAAQLGVPAVSGTLTDELGVGSARATDKSEKTTVLGLTAETQELQPLPSALEGVTTEISAADERITLDLRWTVLCDLFLVVTADSVYDARSRVLLLGVAEALGLTWMDVTTFEKRVTDALEIEEGIERLRDKNITQKRSLMATRRRLLMVGAATVGGGLVIGLSAGLLAPLIGAGLGATLGAVGIGGTTSFLGGVGGAAVITSTATAGGAYIGGRGMTRRTRSVKTFEFRPIHNNKRVNCIVTVPGFMSGPQDDPRLPFSVLDSIMGDVFSVLWEPDMMMEMGNALNILWNETVAMGVQAALAATIAGGLFGALAWPLWLTKLGYLIDNPWSNALDRAKAAGLILADILTKRQLGVRPITLVGFSLGARVIFHALLELARNSVYGVVQDVFLMGMPEAVVKSEWEMARLAVAGRFVNGFNRTDWILGYLHRATSGGLRSIAGLHPVEVTPGIENVELTNAVPGHLAYRALMPLVLDQLGFRCTADYFDEPEDLTKIPEREVVRDDEMELRTVKTKTGGFGKIWKKVKKGSTGGEKSSASSASDPNSVPGTGTATPVKDNGGEYDEDDDDLPPRLEQPHSASTEQSVPEPSTEAETPQAQATDHVPLTTATAASTPADSRPRTPEADKAPGTAVHFDTEAILAELRESGIEVRELESSLPPLVASASPSIVSDSPATQPSTTDLQTTSRPGPRPSQTSEASSSSTYARSFSVPQYAASATSLPSFAEPAPVGDGISLSFASYDDDDDIVGGDVVTPNARGGADLDPISERFAAYGLTPETAQQLRSEFAGPATPLGATSSSVTRQGIDDDRPGGPFRSSSFGFASGAGVGDAVWDEEEEKRRKDAITIPGLVADGGRQKVTSAPASTNKAAASSSLAFDNPWGS